MRYLLFFSFFFLKIFADTWNGDDYARNSSVEFSYTERMLENLSFNGDEKILDVGCGDGKITALLAKKVPNGAVIGIDPSPSMLEKAEEIRNQCGLKNLIFHEGSAESFSFPELFDHIFAIHVMHWIKEQKKALDNIRAHLKAKGRVHFILAPSNEGLPFHNALEKTCRNWSGDFVGFVNPLQAFDMETYRKLMVEAGFHIRVVHYEYYESMHESKERLKNWLKQWLPHGKYLSSDKQNAFLDDLIKNYLEETGLSTATQNPVCWCEYVLFVEASKI